MHELYTVVLQVIGYEALLEEQHDLTRSVCILQDLEYPQVHRLMLHPCVSNDERSINCGDFFSATSILRFQSFFTQKRVVASYTFEVSQCLGASCV